MALTFQYTPQPNTLLALWQIEEGVSALAALCSEAEQMHAREFTSDQRQQEWLAWHALLHAVAPGIEVGYNAQGAPVICEASTFAYTHLSVSHTYNPQGTLVGILLSDHPCGLDIELLSRNFTKAAPRYLHSEEQELSLCMVWCAKEALYKWSGEEGVDFRSEIRISVPTRLDTLLGTIRNRTARLHTLTHDKYCIVYCFG